MLTRARPGAGPQETQLTSRDQVMVELKGSVERLNRTLSDREKGPVRQGKVEEEAHTGKDENELQLALQKKTKHHGRNREAIYPLHQQVDDVLGANDKTETKATKKSGKLNKAATETDIIYDTLNVEPDKLLNLTGIYHESLGCGRMTSLEPRECTFWRQLIRLHLKLIKRDKVKEEQMEGELRSLRDGIVFTFLLVNVLWNIVIFQMQLLKGKLEEFFVPIPRADDPDGEWIRFEPMGFAFLVVFGLVLALQFIGTVIHRWHTLLHTLSRTEIRPTMNRKEAKLRLAEKLQSINEIEEDDDFGIPPPHTDDINFLYHPGKTDNDNGRNQFAPKRNSVSGPDELQHQQRGSEPGMPPTPHGYDRDCQRYPIHGRCYQKCDKRRHHCQYSATIHVGTNSLSRNFMRRFSFLQDYNSEGNEKTMTIPMERARMEREPKKQKGGFNQVYRTVRGMSHQYIQAVMGDKAQEAHENSY